MKILNQSIFKLAILAFFILSSCSGTPIKLGNSDRNFNVKSVDFSRGRDISATTSGFQLLLFIPININDRHERAFQLLRAQAGDNYLTNIKITESWKYGLVGTVYTTKLEGTVYPYN
jgi:hypothetical protein